MVEAGRQARIVAETGAQLHLSEAGSSTHHPAATCRAAARCTKCRDRRRSPAGGPRKFQQPGVELVLRVWRESTAPVEIVPFGLARPIAVAFNREPDLMRAKLARVDLCPGSAPEGHFEWNEMLDLRTFVRFLRSDLRVTIHPCEVMKGPFDWSPTVCTGD